MLFEVDGYQYNETYHPTKAYGLGYVGSKNLIAEKIVRALPTADNLYDLFGGGGAITHCACVLGKYKTIYMNDLDSNIIDFFSGIVYGRIEVDKKFVGREEFFARKDNEALIRMCWSFGNDGRTYFCSKEKEPYKKGAYMAVVFDDFSYLEELCSEFVPQLKDALKGVTDTQMRRLRFTSTVNKIFDFGKKCKSERDFLLHRSLFRIQCLEYMERVEALERLERVERVQSLRGLGEIEFSSKSYDEIEIRPNSVIYCDIPYENTVEYRVGRFDYEKFYDWCDRQTERVFVSSYDLPADRFICVRQISKPCTFQGGAGNAKIERLYIPRKRKDSYDCGGLF